MADTGGGEEPWKKANNMKSRRLNKSTTAEKSESLEREQGKEVKVVQDRVFRLGAGGRQREDEVRKVERRQGR